MKNFQKKSKNTSRCDESNSVKFSQKFVHLVFGMLTLVKSTMIWDVKIFLNKRRAWVYFLLQFFLAEQFHSIKTIITIGTAGQAMIMYGRLSLHLNVSVPPWFMFCVEHLQSSSLCGRQPRALLLEKKRRRQLRRKLKRAKVRKVVLKCAHQFLILVGDNELEQHDSETYVCPVTT